MKTKKEQLKNMAVRDSEYPEKDREAISFIEKKENMKYAKWQTKGRD